jgi:hypothetical protein
MALIVQTHNVTDLVQFILATVSLKQLPRELGSLQIVWFTSFADVMKQRTSGDHVPVDVHAQEVTEFFGDPRAADAMIEEPTWFSSVVLSTVQHLRSRNVFNVLEIHLRSSRA